MFRVVPHFHPISHIDYSLWGREATIHIWVEEEEENCDSPLANSPSVSELSSPLLHRNISDTVNREEHHNHHTLRAEVEEKLSVTDSLFSPSSDTGTVDSAFYSLPPLVTTNTSGKGNKSSITLLGSSPTDLPSSQLPLEVSIAAVSSSLPVSPSIGTHQPLLEEQEDSAEDPPTASLFLPTPDPLSSIDSGLQSLPTQITTNPVPPVSITEELSITSMMLASHSPMQNHRPGTKLSSNNRGRCARCGKLVYFGKILIVLGSITLQAHVVHVDQNYVTYNSGIYTD